MLRKIAWGVWLSGSWCEVRRVRGHGICVLYKTLVLHDNVDTFRDAFDLAEIECLEAPETFKTGIRRRYLYDKGYVGTFCEITRIGIFDRYYLVHKDGFLKHICKTFKQAELCAEYENETD